MKWKHWGLRTGKCIKIVLDMDFKKKKHHSVIIYLLPKFLKKKKKLICKSNIICIIIIYKLDYQLKTKIFHFNKHRPFK